MSNSSQCPVMALTAAAASVLAACAWFFNKRKGIPALPSLPKSEEWFAELSSEMWPGQAFALAVKNRLFHKKSDFQEIAVFDSTHFGRVLTLDGVIQLTTRDEHAYQETLVHTPMALVKNPKRALVIGGGDGGVLRELARYDSLEELHICELDEEVIKTAKKWISQTSVGFEDPRVTIHIEDGFTFLERAAKEGKLFDVIVSDLSDPVGPAEAIFTGNFLELIARALTPRGAASMQGESMWLHGALIKGLMKDAKTKFVDAQYASISIPSYPGGQIGAIVMTKASGVKVDKIVQMPDLKVLKQLKYYTPDLHIAQFVLPRFVRQEIYGEQ